MQIQLTTPVTVPSPAYAPFRGAMDEASLQISYGLQVADEDAGTGADFAVTCADDALAIARAALELEAPAAALETARRGVELVQAGRDHLSITDEDGYPNRHDFRVGVDELQRGMRAFVQAEDLAR